MSPPPLEPLPLDPTEEAFMRAFARAAHLVPKLLDEDLVGGQQLSMSEYFVLAHLSEAPDRRLRMSDLALTATMSLSGMTRVVQRLENTRLVTRSRSGDDGRGWYAVLTEAGLRRLEQAWPTHLGSARQRIFAHLEGVDLVAITTALQRMAQATRGSAGPRDEEDPTAGR